MQPGGPLPASEEVLAALERLVHSVAPMATTWGDGVVPEAYALPGDLVPFLLLRATETGVDVVVPDTSGEPYVRTFEAVDDVGWLDFEHAIRVAVASAEARASPPRSVDGLRGSTTDATRLSAAAFTVGAFFVFDAVRWQRVGIVALLPWAVIVVLIDLVTRRVLGESSPGAPGTSPLPGIPAVVLGASGWALTVRWAYRRFPLTAQQRAAAAGADSEFLRTHARTLGCLAGGAWFLVGGAVLAILGPQAAQGRIGLLATVIILLGIAVIPVVMIRYLRRRYPPGPQTTVERLVDALMLLVLLLMVALGLYSVITMTPTS